jgi:DNA-binding CsgD family transcriptional regulator
MTDPTDPTVLTKAAKAAIVKMAQAKAKADAAARERDAQVARMYVAGGMTAPEIAKALGLSEGSIRAIVKAERVSKR